MKRSSIVAYLTVLFTFVSSNFSIDFNSDFGPSNMLPSIIEESLNNHKGDKGRAQVVEIEIISPKKNLSSEHRHGFPTKALSDIDFFMDSVINSIIDSVIPEHIGSHMLSGSHHEENNSPVIIEFNNEMDKMNKEFDDFFSEETKQKQRKHKKLKKTKSSKEKRDKPLNETIKEIEETIKENPEEKTVEKSTKVLNEKSVKSGLTVKKLITYIIKGISYLAAIGLIVFLAYFTLFSILKSSNTPEERKKYEIDGVEDELKSINRERKENKLY